MLRTEPEGCELRVQNTPQTQARGVAVARSLKSPARAVHATTQQPAKTRRPWELTVNAGDSKKAARTKKKTWINQHKGSCFDNPHLPTFTCYHLSGPTMHLNTLHMISSLVMARARTKPLHTYCKPLKHFVTIPKRCYKLKLCA